MTPTAEELNREIAQQSRLLNDLRRQQADAATVEEVKKKLGDLKRALGQLSGGSREESKKKERLLLKTPKVCQIVLCVRKRAIQAYENISFVSMLRLGYA